MSVASDDKSPREAGGRESVVNRLEQTIGYVSRVHLRDPAEHESPVIKPRADEAEAHLPERLGRYQVVGAIARGGMGLVYKARDVDLGRDVALKVLLEGHGANADLIRRFVEEAQIGGQLQHPGIVPVHEMGLLAGERPYFAMKLVKGRTLARLLQDRKDPAEDRQRFLGIFEQICQPVAYAHARSVIHRDLKPSNVMVGAFGEVQVMDWGLAKVLARGGVADDARASGAESKLSVIETVRSGSSTVDSLAGSVLGTPAYMPPEQARGDIEALDERSDVFGLGAILCEILTGSPPYTGSSTTEVEHKAKKGYTEDALARLDASGADREVVDLARRCLAFEARDRPRDAGAVATEIRSYLESLEGRARALEIRAAKMRLTLTLGSLLALAVLILGGTIVGFEFRRRARLHESTMAVEQTLAKARELAAEARAAGPEGVPKWSAALEAALHAGDLAAELDDEALLAAVRSEREAIEQGKRNQELLARLDTLREGPTFPWFSPLILALSYEEAFRGFLGGDIDALERAAAGRMVRESGLGEKCALALCEWALLREHNQQDYRHLIEVAREVDPDPWRARLRQAILSRDIQEIERLLASAPESPESAALLSILGTSLADQGRSEEAEKVLRLAWRLDPGNWLANFSLGIVLLGAGTWGEEVGLTGRLYPSTLRAPAVERAPRYEEAVKHLTVAWVLDQTSLNTLGLLGAALSRKGDAAMALETFCDLARRVPVWPVIYEEMLHVLEREQPAELGGALDGAVDTLAGLIERDPSVHPLACEAYGVAITLRWHEGDGDAAMRIADRLVKDSQGQSPFALALLARVRNTMDEREEAIRILEQAVALPDAHRRHAHLLERYREALHPTVVSVASIDAALEKHAHDPAWRRMLLEKRSEQPLLAAYLEGRLHQLDGEHQEAVAKYREALRWEVREDLAQLALWFRLAESLRALKRGDTTERELRALLLRPGQPPVELWNLWLAVQFVDLHRSPADITIPRAGGYAEDLRWLLEALRAGRGVRINCGGGDYQGSSGAAWGRDRFFVQGQDGVYYSEGIEKTGDAELYRSHRWFPPGWIRLPGYSIPLPPRRYQVVLHFAETWPPYARAGIRVCDIMIEGRMVEEGCDPFDRAGFATADARTYAPIVVEDGVLDIQLVHHTGREPPAIRAIAIDVAE